MAHWTDCKAAYDAIHDRDPRASREAWKAMRDARCEVIRLDVAARRSAA